MIENDMEVHHHEAGVPIAALSTVADALQDEDIARGVIYAISQPPHVDVNEILVRPTAQAG